MSDHLIVVPERATAEAIAADLVDEGFTEARVLRQPLAGDDDAEAAEWGVLVVEELVVDESGPVESGLRTGLPRSHRSTTGGTTPIPDVSAGRQS